MYGIVPPKNQEAPGPRGCYNILTSSSSLARRKDTKLAKVNYSYEKRQKELAKKRKKEQKEKLKQIKKNIPSQESQVTQDTQESPPVQQSDQ